MKNRTAKALATASVVSAAIVGVAMAHVGQSEKTTTFQVPQWYPHNVDCTWAETHTFGKKDTLRGQDDDGGSGFWNSCWPASTRQAHSQATAEGEQIEAYGWAYDSCVGDTAAATSAISHGKNDTSFTITKTNSPVGCYSLMRVDMRPWFKARVDVDAPGSATAHGSMMSVCPAILNTSASIDGSAQSDGGVNNSGWSFGQSSTSGGFSVGGVSTGGIGGGSVEHTFTTYVGAQTPCDSATVNVCCTVDVAVRADAEGDWIDVAEAEAWVWDSKPGVDLHANCPTTCLAYAYWLY